MTTDHNVATTIFFTVMAQVTQHIAQHITQRISQHRVVSKGWVTLQFARLLLENACDWAWLTMTGKMTPITSFYGSCTWCIDKWQTSSVSSSICLVHFLHFRYPLDEPKQSDHFYMQYLPSGVMFRAESAPQLIHLNLWPLISDLCDPGII